MASAEVGDDVFGEDPTVSALEQRVADLLGHEAGLFTPTGSMANQLGMRLHVGARPGGRLPTQNAHVVRAELGAAAVFSGHHLAHLAVGARAARGRGRPDVARDRPASGRTRSRPRSSSSRTRTTSAAARCSPSRRSARLRAATSGRRGRDAPRRRAALERPRRLRGVARRLRPRVRHRVGLPVQGARRAGRVGARRVGRADGRGAGVAQALRRRDAPGRDPGRGRAARPRPPPRAARRRPRAGRRASPRPAPRRRPGRSTPPRWRRTSSSSTSARPAGPRRASSPRLLEHGVRTYAVGPAAVRLVWHLDVDDEGTTAAVDAATAVLRSAPSAA